MNEVKIILVDPVRCISDGDISRIQISTEYSGTSVGIRDPIGLEYIAGYLLSKGIQAKVIQQNELSDEKLISTILENKPKAVGFSLWTYNIQHVIDLAQRIKNANPDIKIIVGGHHPSGDPSIVLDPNIDFAVLGEGEETTRELLEFITNRVGDLNKIKGIAFKDKTNQVVVNEKRERLNFEDLPHPHRSSEILEKSKVSGLAYPPASKQVNFAQVMYSRGCPRSCSFCPSGKLWHQEIKYRRPVDVIAEIKDLIKRFRTNFLYFVDLTFNENEEKVRELCTRMIDERVVINWAAMLRIGIEDETLRLMKAAGCSRVSFGVELIEPDLLHKVKPWQNQDMIKRDLLRADSFGFIVRAFLLMGFPWETERHLEFLNRNLRNFPVDIVRLAFVCPFPGTGLYDRYGDDIRGPYVEFTGDYPMFNSQEKNKAIATRQEIIRNFYSSCEYLDRVSDKIRRFPHLRESYNYFFMKHLLPSGIITEVPNFLRSVTSERRNADSEPCIRNDKNWRTAFPPRKGDTDEQTILNQPRRMKRR